MFVEYISRKLWKQVNASGHSLEKLYPQENVFEQVYFLMKEKYVSLKLARVSKGHMNYGYFIISEKQEKSNAFHIF